MPQAVTAPLITRVKLFGNPARTDCQISPDGRWLSWLAPKDGVLNVWLAPAEDIDAARMITNDRKRGIRFYGWMPGATHVVYLQDEGGTEDWHVYVVDLASQETRDLTPVQGVQAHVQAESLDHPYHLVVGLNDRDKAWHDLYRLDIRTGDRELVWENRQQLSRFVFDRQLNPRLASRTRQAEGGRIRYRIDGGKLEPFDVIAHADDLTTYDVGFTREGGTVYSVSSVGRDKAALLARDWTSGAEHVLAAHPKADVGRVLTHPETDVVEAVVVEHVRREWIPLTEPMASDLKHLHANLPGEIWVTTRTRDDKRWIVVASRAEAPATYHLYERTNGDLVELFSTRPELKSYALAPMRSEIIRSRDGLDLVSYLTLPERRSANPKVPSPMVLLVHGGPWGRDEYGFNPQHQWLADRGYAVLSTNFRGSAGFGKAFLNAGDLEWGRKMHDDLLDAVAWAVREGIADPDRVAIMGASYGGYATLAGLAFTPEVFCCGVDIVGPSNLETLLATVPPYWAAFFENLARRVGDPRTEAGRAILRERSPLHAAGNIAKPLLIGHGANDPRVKQAESDQIIAAMRAKGLPVTYVLYPEEGHGFAIPENRLSFYAVAEAFLAKHLRGAVEPIADALNGTNLLVPEGGAHIPGLEAALATRANTGHSTCAMRRL